MKQWVFVIACCSFMFCIRLFAVKQCYSIIDTVETDQGPVILYKNFTWEYLGDEPV